MDQGHSSGTPKTALVLAGGGIPGWMYEVGCLTALDDFFDNFSVNQFDIYVGTSAGAAVAALMANGIKPREIYEDIKFGRKTPANFARKDIYGLGYQETYSMIKKFFRSLFQIAKYYYQSKAPISLLEILEMLQESLPSGIFTIKKLDIFLANLLSQGGYTNDFRKLKKELYIPAVNLDLGQYDVFGEAGPEAFDEVPISLAVSASSAIPIFFQPVHINGNDYIDGGVGRVAYMDIAMNHGAELMWIINPIQYIKNDRKKVRLPSIMGGAPTIKEKGVAYIYDQSLRINTATRIYLAIKRYCSEHPKKDFVLMQPDQSATVLFSHHPVSFNAKTEIMQYGYLSTMEKLKAEFGYYQDCLSRYQIKCRLDKFTGP
ncbi:MAG: patatin-like phospholipase family protein [Nitrospirota bacterium]